MSGTHERFEFWLDDRLGVVELWPAESAEEALHRVATGWPQQQAWALRQSVGHLVLLWDTLPDVSASHRDTPVAADLGQIRGVRILLGPTLRSRFGIEILVGVLTGPGAMALSDSLRDLPPLRDEPSFATAARNGGISRYGEGDYAEFIALTRNRRRR